MHRAHRAASSEARAAASSAADGETPTRMPPKADPNGKPDTLRLIETAMTRPS